MKQPSHFLRIAMLVCTAMAALMVTECKKPEPEPEPQPVPLAAPVPEIEAVTVNTATVKWNDIEGAISYEIHLGDDGTPYKALKSPYTITGLESDTEYTIRMRAFPESSRLDVLASDYSDFVKFKTAARQALATPVPAVSAQTTTSFTISWETIEDAASYEYVFNGGETLSTEEISLNFTGLEVNTEYSFKVRAVPSEEGLITRTESAWAEISTRTNNYAALDSPSPRLVSVTCTIARIEWDEIENAESYTYKFDNYDEESEIDYPIAVMGGLTANTTYSFFVRANPAPDQKTFSCSAWAEFKFTTANKSVLAAPVAQESNESTTSFTISWAPVENAAKYAYVFNGGAQAETTLTAVDFTGLTANTEYSFKVKAIPDNTESFEESSWTEITAKTSNKVALATPQPDVVYKDAHNIQIVWDEVENAESYVWKVGVDGEETISSRGAALIEGLQASTAYDIYIAAKPAEGSALYVSSEWAKITVTTDDATAHGNEGYEREDGEW